MPRVILMHGLIELRVGLGNATGNEFGACTQFNFRFLTNLLKLPLNVQAKCLRFIGNRGR